MKKWIVIIIVGLVVFRYYGQHRDAGAAAPVAVTDTATALEAEGPERPDPLPAPSFRCDGRVYCSQMTSCEEATFFLRNCPNVKMDGEGDGIPCEKQWCVSVH